MPKRISTARGREFGAGVRAAIASAGLTSREVADILDWDEAKLSDVVNGKGGANQLEIATLLGACRVGAAEFAHLLSLHPQTAMKAGGSRTARVCLSGFVRSRRTWSLPSR
jgi:hypothetical protein